MKYLTPELKNYYMEDFKRAIECKDEYFKIENCLINTLFNINKNQNIQTLYSKKCVSLKVDHPHSYIFLSITKEFEPKLIELFSQLKTTDVEFAIMRPKKIKPFVNEHPLAKDVGCVSNENFFNVSVFVIQLFSNKLNEHKKFWKEIELYLTQA